VYFFALSFAGCFGVFAADVDESKLPAAAPVKIDFARDIQPIFENSCLRCHGPEKTKSKFRVDNRVSAIKGGEKGVDILPGNSAKSPLIHYVAGLVEDMQMPPEGKGDALTTNQVALLRAWIDQGAKMDGAPPTNNFAFSITPIIGVTGVKGDAQKFREHYWQKEGANGGLEEFQLYEQLDPNTKYLLSGHALQDDYNITLDVDRNDIGFVHTGWQQYRKYFDDTGGYYPAHDGPSSLKLGQDLHLDIGKAWIDFGLTLPDWPTLVLGYEYDFKQGDEAETGWSAASPSQPNIAPVARSLNEGTHILKLDIDYELDGLMIEDQFRGEFYRLDESYHQADSRTTLTESVAQGTTYFQGANTLRLEKKFSDWFFGSAGYLYSKLNSEANFTDSFALGFVSAVPDISLEKESHVFNINGLLGPFHGLTLSTGVQSEWTRQQGFGSGALNPANTDIPLSVLAPIPTTLSSDYDDSSFSENVALRYTAIPWTVLFAEGRLRQERIGETELDNQPDNAAFGNYLLNTDLGSQMTDMRVGFSTSPWQSVSLSAHYRRYENDSHYNNDANSLPVGAYPGFLQSRDILTDEAEAKLVLHPINWLKTTLSYQYLTSDYRDSTGPVAGISPGGDVLAGESITKIYSINAVVTPWRRLYLSSTFAYQPSVTITEDNGFNGIAPYRGHTYSLLANATYVLDQKTDLSASYSFSEADFGQNNILNGLPVGMEYQMNSIQVALTRRLTKQLSAKLLYSFNKYEEPSEGNALNYEAHTIFASLSFKLR
jgi:hypothetical protein